MTRRQILLAGAATLAGAAGIGVALREDRLAQSGAEALWGLHLERPEGGSLALNTLRTGPLLVNFWATWCPPCVREFPELDRFHREFQAQGWHVLGIAIDEAAPVRQFLARHPVGFTIVLGGASGMTLVRQLGNVSGGLPYTVLIDRQGRILARKLGESDFAQLSKLASTL